MRRTTLIATALLALAGAEPANAAPQGCVVTNPPNALFPNPCANPAGDDWVYVAHGDWEIRIERDGATRVLSSANGDPAISTAGAIGAGDYATARALTPGSSVTMGNPSPLAPDGEDPAPVPMPETEPPEDGRIAISEDGTPIVYVLLLPKGTSASSPAPAAITTHGWGGNRYGADPVWNYATRYLLNAGYAVLSYDSRGFGESGGTAQIQSVDHEAKDVRALVDVLAADPRIATERPGDPRVGMYGESYAGAIQFPAAALDRRIDALAPSHAWHDPVESLAPQGMFKTSFAAMLTGAGVLSGDLDPMFTRFMAEGLATGSVSPEPRAWLRARAAHRVLDRVRAPTLVVAGQQDRLFPPSQQVAIHRTLSRRLAPGRLKLTWECGGHGTCKPSSAPGLSEVDRVHRDRVRWFDRWVRGDATVPTGARFDYLTQDGVWHEAKRYPPRGRRWVRAFGSGVVASNGEPGVGGGADPATALPPLPLSDRPQTPLGQPPRPAATSMKVSLPPVRGTILGAPRVRLELRGVGSSADAGSRAPLLFRLIERRTGTVLGNQETPRMVRLGAKRRAVSFRLEPVAWAAGPAHDLALEILTASSNFDPYRGAAIVRVDRVAARVPVLDRG